MEEQKFDLLDIKDFMLEKLNLRWYGMIFDGVQYRTANIKDFSRINSWRFQCKDMKNPDWGLMDVINVVTEGTFRVIRRGDYSQEWQEFLAQRYNQAQSL